MKTAFIRTSVMAATAVLVAAFVVRPVALRSAAEGERFLAQAVNTDSGGSAQVEIAIERWSTEAERKSLVATLREKGPEKLLSELQRLPRWASSGRRAASAGTFTTPTTNRFPKGANVS